MNTAEKIETIVLCRKSGTLGQYATAPDGWAHVTVDGRTYAVRCGRRF